MKAALFDPYLDTLGGGERYVMTVAEYLLRKKYSVDIFWNDQSIKEKIKERFAIDINHAKFVNNPFSYRNNLFEKWRILKHYDAIFYLSDGSIPLLFSKRNILHFQVPFRNVSGKSFLNRLKISRIDSIICNSFFTKKHIDKEFGVKSKVIYPPVSIDEFRSGEKENIILAVGRFSKTLNAKKQDVLVEVFKKIYKRGIKNWGLILAGGALDEDNEYLNELKRSSNGYPVKIFTNIIFDQLKELYAKAKIFWHAAGFGEDEKLSPQKTEHFGMTTVEAMSAGCVPVVLGKGGLPEIVKHNVDGFLWLNHDDLIDYTCKLIEHENLRQKMSLRAIVKSKDFSKKIFFKKLDEIFLN